MSHSRMNGSHGDSDDPFSLVQKTASSLMDPIYQTCAAVKKVTRIIQKSQTTQQELWEVQRTGQLTTGQIIGMRRIEKRVGDEEACLVNLGLQLDRIEAEMNGLEERTGSYDVVFDKTLPDIRSLLDSKFRYKLPSPAPLKLSPAMPSSSEIEIVPNPPLSSPSVQSDTVIVTGSSARKSFQQIPRHSSSCSSTSRIPKPPSSSRKYRPSHRGGGDSSRQHAETSYYNPEPSFNHGSLGNGFGSVQSIASSFTSSVSTHRNPELEIHGSGNNSGMGTFTIYAKAPQLVSSTPRKAGQLRVMEPVSRTNLSPIETVDLSYVPYQPTHFEMGSARRNPRPIEPVLPEKKAQLTEHELLIARLLGK